MSRSSPMGGDHHLYVCACALALAAALAGCRESGVQGCLDLNAAQRHAEAARRCAEVFAAEADPRAGEALMRAHYFLGNEEEVLAWMGRLVKTGKVPPGAWGLAAAVHEQQGKTAEAEAAYRRALALSRAQGDHRRTADVLYRLFHLAWGRADHRELFLLASEALQEAARAEDPGLQAHAAQAVYTVLYEIGDLEGARRALEAAEGLSEAEDPSGRANLLNNLGTVLFAEGRPALARRHFEQALALWSDPGDRQFLRGIHLNLTEVHLELGDAERAAGALAEAWRHVEPDRPRSSSLLYSTAQVALARGRLDEAAQALATAFAGDPQPEWAWRLAHQQGVLAEARGDAQAAAAAYRRSIAVVEEMRRSLAFDELKSWLLDDKRQPFEALFRLEARSGRADAALATAERAQARTFLDAFLHASSGTGTPAGKPWSPAASLSRMDGLESLLPLMSESPVAALQPIDRVLRAFGDRHGLVYFEAGDDLWLLVVTGQRVRLHALAVPAAEVRRLGGRFLAHPEDAGTAGRLGEILLPPGALPDEGRTVHVVADGLLGNLPLAALRREGRYLVESHPVVFIPSLAALAALESRRAGPAGPPVVLASPQGDLPAAASEAVVVARLLGGTARLGGEATSGELGRASRARALHLAAHTGLGPRGPWLQLADRRITASEVVAGRIGPRLAVLASCSSGVRPGRQMWGSLGAAFLAAGSRAVLASLWSVDDAEARELVLRFYAAGGARDPGRALARAQRVAIGRGASPNAWAPFVLFGSDRPL